MVITMVTPLPSLINPQPFSVLCLTAGTYRRRPHNVLSFDPGSGLFSTRSAQQVWRSSAPACPVPPRHLHLLRNSWLNACLPKGKGN